MMTEIKIDEEFLKEMIVKLLSFMTAKQIKQVELWLKESNIELEDIK
jgi:hypothetical protein